MPPPRPSSRTMGRFPVNAPAAGQDWRELASSSRAMENGNNNRVSDASGGSGSGAGTRSSSSSSTASGKTEVPAQQSQQQQQQGEEESSEQKGTVASGKGHGLHVGVNDMVRQGPGDELSSVILSSEAERILDNAKKRLTVGPLCILLAENVLITVYSSWRAISPGPVHQCGPRQCHRHLPRHHRLISHWESDSASQSAGCIKPFLALIAEPLLPFVRVRCTARIRTRPGTDTPECLAKPTSRRAGRLFPFPRLTASHGPSVQWGQAVCRIIPRETIDPSDMIPQGRISLIDHPRRRCTNDSHRFLMAIHLIPRKARPLIPQDWASWRKETTPPRSLT